MHPPMNSREVASQIPYCMVRRAQALLTQLAGFFVAGSHCIANHAITVRTTGAPPALSRLNAKVPDFLGRRRGIRPAAQHARANIAISNSEPACRAQMPRASRYHALC